MSPAELKPITEITTPDSRARFLDRSLEQYYSKIDALILGTKVPKEIIQQFEIAKNLLLYSWYVYEFNPISEMHAISTVELSLKMKIGQTTIKAMKLKGLYKLLKYAIDNRWIVDEGFSQYGKIREREINGLMHWKEVMEMTGQDFQIPMIKHDPQEYTNILLEAFPSLRNEIAHGSTYLSPHGYLTLELCRDFINQLFKD
jgi:hypothetical protein